jgi:hypothetical protein
MPAILHFESAREFLFRTVSQITLNYRDGPLSEGAAGDVHGGDRLPWVAVNGSDNFSSLTRMTWQVHVYGNASDALRQWCTQHAMPLEVFEWHAQHEAAGLARNALYLIRPDTYVALADSAGKPEALDIYLTSKGIKLPTSRAMSSAALDNGARTGAAHES